MAGYLCSTRRFIPRAFEAHSRAGRPGARPRARLSTSDVAPSVQVAIGDDLDRCRNAVKPTLALYIGGMGAKGKNFYNSLACRYGYEAEAETIQDLYLAGRKKEAIAAVPDALVDQVALCGPEARVAERVQAWKEAGVTTLICMLQDVGTLQTMAAIRERL